MGRSTLDILKIKVSAAAHFIDYLERASEQLRDAQSHAQDLEMFAGEADDWVLPDDVVTMTAYLDEAKRKLAEFNKQLSDAMQ